MKTKTHKVSVKLTMEVKWTINLLVTFYCELQFTCRSGRYVALNTVGTTKIGKVGHQFKDMCNRWFWLQTLMTYFTWLYLLNPKGGLAWSHSFLIGCLCISYKGLEGCNCNFPQTKIHHFLLVENAIVHWSTKRSGMWPHEFIFSVLQLTDSWPKSLTFVDKINCQAYLEFAVYLFR